MSVIPIPAAPDESAPATFPPALRLVTRHDHAWELRSVEYDDGLEVRRYECGGCEDVLFR